MNEEWKDIKGYEGLYQISKSGKVKSLEKRLPHNASKTGFQVFKESIRKTFLCGSSRGYECVDLYKNRANSKKLIHRLVAEAFIKNYSDKLEVNHIDANTKNNSLENLEMCTRQENVDHYYENHKLYKGYYVNNITGGDRPYYSRINACGHKVSLGYYKTAKEAQDIFREAYLNWYGKEPKLLPVEN